VDDPYRVLGLEPRASAEQIERAYRFCLELYAEGSLALYSLLEPNAAEAQRGLVREAYETLSDPQRRRDYDASRGLLPPEGALLAFAAPVAPAAELPAELSGPDLRRLREARGLSLRQIAAVTKIGVRFLEYIEEDRLALLPPPVYLRGFLQEYGRLLGLDPRAVADAYLAHLK
jgi:flagellar biosynthesis protein FlhG